MCLKELWEKTGDRKQKKINCGIVLDVRRLLRDQSYKRKSQTFQTTAYYLKIKACSQGLRSNFKSVLLVLALKIKVKIQPLTNLSFNMCCSLKH